MDAELTALLLNCTLKPEPIESSTQLLSKQISAFLSEAGVICEEVRVVDRELLPGVERDMGDSDEWPTLLDKLLASDMLIMLTPTWLGQHSSVAQRVLERLDAELGEVNENGDPTLFNKVAVAGVLGNEDGAHHIVGIFYQALNDVGFTIPAQGCIYWNGETMHKTDYKDLGGVPEVVAVAMRTALANAIHLAKILRENSYPQTNDK